jgi:hypothetical protein
LIHWRIDLHLPIALNLSASLLLFRSLSPISLSPSSLSLSLSVSLLSQSLDVTLSLGGSGEKKNRRGRKKEEEEDKKERRVVRSVLKAECGGESQGWVTAVIMTVMSHDAESTNEMMTL